MGVNSKFLKNYYNSVYKGNAFGYVIHPDLWIQKYISYIPKGTVLELGIGTGKNVDFLLENNFFVEGIDLSNVIIDKLKSKYKDSNCKFWVDDITKINIEKEKYSLVICSMVLSHLSELEISTLIDKVKNGLIPGGCVYLSTMSKDDPMNFHKMINTYNLRNARSTHLESLKRTFLDKYQVKEYFGDFDIIELADIYQKEPKRTTADGYFGLIMYLGKKSGS